MIVDSDTIRQAFDQHLLQYAGLRDWDISYHVRCWNLAREAFSRGSFEHFVGLYEELRGRWQVFRGSAGQPWPAKQTFDRLMALGTTCSSKRLSECSLDSLHEVWNVLDALKEIQPTKSGPPVVAISKFLHFWNPRLFIIVDRGVMWQNIFSHGWLWDEISGTKKSVEAVIPTQRTVSLGDACDLASYLSILLWAGDLLRKNPQILGVFDQYVKTHAKGAVEHLRLAQYEAAAVEWFLLGLVEIPPPGVVLDKDT